jgi:raffinose/stachyose/melibiose transport system substrate-binding protein
MTNLRKLFCLALAVLMVSAAFAEKKKLVFFGLNDFDTPDFFKPFEDANNVTIEKILQPSDKFKEAILVAINGGQQLDVGLINGQDIRSFSSKGLLSDLTTDVKYMDRFFESSARQYMINGKQYALPAATIWNMGLFYNKDIFAKYGLTPPKTFADMLNINKVLTKNGIAGIAVGAANAYDLTNWYFVNFFQASGNKGLERTIATLQGKAKFTDPDYVEAMADVQKYAKNGFFQKGFLGADGTARLATFASGKAGMFFTGNWDIGAMKQAGLDGSKIGVVNWPLMKNGVKAQVSGTAAGAAACIYSKSAPENRELALKLLDYLTSDSMNVKMNQKMGTFLSTNKNVKIPGIDPLNQQIQSDLVPTIVTFLDWYWPPEVTKVFAEELQSVMALRDSPEAAMAKVQKAFNGLVANGYSYDAVK